MIRSFLNNAFTGRASTTSSRRRLGNPRSWGVKAIGVNVAILAVLAMSAVDEFGIVGAQPAEAAVFDSAGSPGYASFPKMAAAIHWGQPSLYPDNYYVTRSSAYSGTQYVRVKVQTYGWNPSLQRWVAGYSYSSGVFLAPGQAGWVNFNWISTFYKNIHAEVIVTWQNASTGATVGVRHADYTSTTDYIPVPNGGAQVFPNATVGAYVHYLL